MPAPGSSPLESRRLGNSVAGLIAAERGERYFGIRLWAPDREHAPEEFGRPRRRAVFRGVRRRRPPRKRGFLS